MSLRANDFLYRQYLDEVRTATRADGDAALFAVERAASIAWRHHPGRFSDGALENLLLERGQRLERSAPSQPPCLPVLDDFECLTLHVASQVYATGGHSRVLTNWIRTDDSCRHAVVLTRQNGPLPDFLVRIWQQRGAKLSVLDSGLPIVDRARAVRALAANATRVILHHHPDDAVPTVAFARAGGCPVAMFNHAHFSFSLGNSVADLTINTLPYYQEISVRRRFPRATALLTGTGEELGSLAFQPVDKRAACERLGVPPDHTLVMTIGTERYFAPTDQMDFFRTASTILERRPEVFIVFVGVPADFPAIPPNLRGHDRVRFEGPVNDPVPYYQASTLCLESFPMPSLGAVLEAIIFGEAYPVLSYTETENIIRPSLPGLPRRRRDEESYLDEVCTLLDNPAATQEGAAALRLQAIREDEASTAQLSELYRQLDALPHAPAPTPVTDCEATLDDELLAAIGPQEIGPSLARARRGLYGAHAHLTAAIKGFEPWRHAVRGVAKALLDAIKAAGSHPQAGAR